MAAIVRIRIEGNDGIYRAYAIDGEAAVAGTAGAFAEFYSEMPKAIRGAVDTFLFALRHGPIQGMFKSKGYSPVDIEGLDKNAQTIGHLAQLYIITLMEKARDPNTGEAVPIDMPANQMSFLMENIISRIPEYDRNPHELLEAPSVGASES